MHRVFNQQLRPYYSEMTGCDAEKPNKDSGISGGITSLIN